MNDTLRSFRSCNMNLMLQRSEHQETFILRSRGVSLSSEEVVGKLAVCTEEAG